MTQRIDPVLEETQAKPRRTRARPTRQAGASQADGLAALVTALICEVESFTAVSAENSCRICAGIDPKEARTCSRMAAS